MGKNFRSPSQATTTSVNSFSELSRGERIRQKTRNNFRTFTKFMYNKEKRTFCNKSCKDWFYVILFYTLFMSILCGVFFGIIVLIMYMVRFTRTEALFPKDSLLPGSSPALGISPRLAHQVTALIWYTHNETKHSVAVDTYISVIDKLLEPYENLNHSAYVDCAVNIPMHNQSCIFKKEELGPCGKAGYGYTEDKPCIYLKLNKIRNWRPEHRNKREDIEKQKTNEHIRIACNGVTCFDRDHVGNFSYYPGPFFKDYFFPYDGSLHYRSPLVAVQFENLERGFVIGVKCFALENTANLQDESLHTATAFFYIDAKQ